MLGTDAATAFQLKEILAKLTNNKKPKVAP